MKKSFAVFWGIAVFLSSGLFIRIQAQNQETTYQNYLNLTSGCFERIFKGDEAKRTVAASQIVAALNDGACVLVTHATVDGVIDLTTIAPTSPTNLRKVVASIRITDSALPGIKAGALGDVAKTVFSASVDFSGSRIEGDAEFVDVIFSNEAIFQGTTFSGIAAMNGASFHGKMNFSQARFEQLAFFFGAHFEQEAIFVDVEFMSTVRLFNVAFESSVDFSNVTFGSTIDMSNSRYGGKTSFSNAHFIRGAIAKNIEFVGPTRFDGVRIDDAIDFSTTRFHHSATFSRGAFSGARFFNVRFSRGADFSGARFITDTSFNSALFEALTFFTGATFEQSVLFRSTIFLGDSLFTNVKFMGDADFSSARFSANLGPDFSGTQFEKTLNLDNVASAGALRLTWEQVKTKLNPENAQILILLEKSFTELRQSEDAVAACEASAKLQKQDAGLPRCVILGATLGILPQELKLSNAKKDTENKIEEKANSKKEEKKRQIDPFKAIPLIVILASLVLLALFGIKGGKP